MLVHVGGSVPQDLSDTFEKGYHLLLDSFKGSEEDLEEVKLWASKLKLFG